MVERYLDKVDVAGSIPAGATKIGELAEWLNATDCKSVPNKRGGSNPSLPTKFRNKRNLNNGRSKIFI